MYLGVYRFEGEPAALLAAYRKLLAEMPTGNFQLHVCVERERAIEIYDACPDRETFEAFAASPRFRSAVGGAGLPSPKVMPLGDARTAFLNGQRVV